MALVGWRISTRRDRAAAFDGEGARLYGGRWNRRGTRMVYAAEHLSLAALELFVHLDPEDAPPVLYSFRLELPEDAVQRLPAQELPAAWRTYPAPPETMELGTRWARRNESLALVVPSTLIPEEHNVLVNPAHPRGAELVIGEARPFSFDPRMWKQGP